MKQQRISVSMPPDMLAHYKLLAEESGISVSRLIYLRLRSKKKIYHHRRARAVKRSPRT